MRPNYVKIFSDILDDKYPNKKKVCLPILSKNSLAAIDILKINTIIFGNSQIKNNSSKHKSYDLKSIKNILEFQKIHKLNNLEISNHFSVSRNTITKWKKLNLTNSKAY